MTTVLVTGANRGIGLEFVKQYAAAGAEVLACCRAPARAEALKKISGKVRIMALDVADPKSVTALKRELGDVAIDIVINNAGIGLPPERNGIDYDAWLNVFRVNSLGPMIVSEALRDNLRRGKEKKIATITSGLGSIAGNSGGWTPYRASKAAVNSLMKNLAVEWAGDGITVAILSPGWVKTDMGGAGASLTPEQSVTALRARIAELSPKTSGHFLGHTGNEIAW
jgi:NAD(P)-dependent dehydrogenase (short-subunit alcohol dehydrogenase family)